MNQFIVEQREGGVKLSSFLQTKLGPDWSLKKIKRHLDKKGAQVNGRSERFASRLLRPKDVVRFEPVEKTVPLSIIYEEEGFVVLNKPAGLVSTEKLFPHAHLVHRLDKETSGILIMAKTLEMKSYFEEAFCKRAVLKRYLALGFGNLRERSGILKTKMGPIKELPGQTIWGSHPEGKSAITAWNVLKSNQGYHLIECRPETGRTHQIRVHMKELGVPLLGDYQYDPFQSHSIMPSRHLLHASSIALTHPVSGVRVQFDCLPPTDFQAAYKEIFGENFNHQDV